MKITKQRIKEIIREELLREASFKKLIIPNDTKNKKLVSVDWTSVCYLNDNYVGGETVIAENKIKPKKGRLVVFPSKKLYHGVLPVEKSSRFTFISWWSNYD